MPSLSSGLNSLSLTQQDQDKPITRFFFVQTPKNYNHLIQYPIVFIFHGAHTHAHSQIKQFSTFVEQYEFIAILGILRYSEGGRALTYAQKKKKACFEK